MLHLARKQKAARKRGDIVSQDAYLNDKCEVQHRNVARGYGVYAISVTEPGALIGMWGGLIVGPDALDSLPEAIRGQVPR